MVSEAMSMMQRNPEVNLVVLMLMVVRLLLQMLSQAMGMMQQNPQLMQQLSQQSSVFGNPQV